MKKSIGSFITLNRKGILLLGVALCMIFFGVVAWRTNASGRTTDPGEEVSEKSSAGSFADGLGWLVGENVQLLKFTHRESVSSDDGDEDHERIRGNAKFDEAEYLRLREEYIAMLRGVEPGKPFDFRARPRAIDQLRRQKDEIESAARASQETDQPLALPSWTPIGPNPIPNGQVTGALAVTGRATALAIDPTNTNKVYLGTAQGGIYRSTNGGTTWTQIFNGASTSAIGALALAPSDPTKLFVGTGEANGSADSYDGVGMYRIDNCDTSADLVGPINPVRNYNDGSNNPQSVPVFNGRSISSIVVHPTDPSIVFVGIASGAIGIGGESPLGNTIPPLGMRGLVRLTNATSAPASVVAQKLTVTLAPGGFDTPNTGNRNVNDMFLDPSDPNILTVWINGNAAAGDGGVYQSTNAQAANPTFTQTLVTTTSGARASFAGYRDAANTTIYAATGESSNGRIRRSVDGGATWSGALSAGNTSTGTGFCGGQCFYNIGLDVRPGATTAVTDDIVVLGGNTPPATVATINPSRLFAKSTDGGVTFTESSAGLHADTHVVRIDPANNNVIWHLDDGGVFKTANGGTNWSSLNNSGINSVQFSGLAVHPTIANWALGGTQDNGTSIRNGAGVWNRVDFGDGGYALVDRNATDETNVTLYHTYFNQTNNLIGFGRVLSSGCATDGQWAFRGIYGGVVVPTVLCDGVDVFNGISLTDAVLFYAPMELGPGNPNTVYFGAGKVYRSTDKGQTMPAVSQSSSSPVSTIAVSPQDDNYRMFGRVDGTIFYTTTGANPMTALAGIPAKYVARAKFDPTNKNTAYIALGGYFGGTSPAQSHVWKITNLNTAPVVTAVNSGLPDVPVNAFAIDPTNGNNLFAGTDIGVYNSTNGGATWTPYGTGLPVVAVFGAEIQPTGRILRIATHGRGMWDIPIDNLATPTLSTAVTSATVTVGNPISDNVTVTGIASSGGSAPTTGDRPTVATPDTVTFNLYGPNDANCTGGVVYTNTVSYTTGGVPVGSGTFTPTQAGVYRWIASYGGNGSNSPVSGACNDANENVTVNVATPTISTNASPGITVGAGTVSDTATLTGRYTPPLLGAPNGDSPQLAALDTITFNLYGPNDATCTGAPVFTSAPMSIPFGGGTVGSGPFTPTQPGTYRWIASYNGNANNAAVSGACNDTNENVVVSPVATPVITTTASANITIGAGPISDTATVTGISSPPTAPTIGDGPTAAAQNTVTFNLYGPDNATCAGAPIYSNTVNYFTNGVPVGSGPYTPTQPGVYRWIASYSGNFNNPPVSGACNDPNENVTVNVATPTISTNASPGITVGAGNVSDTATVSGRYVPVIIESPIAKGPSIEGGETVTFRLYGPNDATCTGAPIFTSAPISYSGGSVGSGPFTPTQAGTYRWIASYSGNANNAPVAGACNAVNENVVVAPAGPVLTTTASGNITIGAGTLSDSVTVTGIAVPPPGAPTIGDGPNVPAPNTVTFSLYGPNDATCANPAIFTSTVNYPTGGVPVSSTAFTPIQAGVYRWIASYSGNANNSPVSGACNDPNENVTVNVATPTISTNASSGIAVGAGTVSDTATLAGRYTPPIQGAPSGNGPQTVALDTITFNLYGPNDANCTGSPVFTSAPISLPIGGGAVGSGPFTPTQPGTYRWIASYSGNANNAPVTGACNAPNESVVVTAPAPVLTTTASATIAVGAGQISDNAIVTGRVSPPPSIAEILAPNGINALENVSFALYGPDNATCSGAPIFTSSVNYPSGGGTVNSGGFTPVLPGVYRWIANYSGNANNPPVAGACNDPNESTVVTPAAPKLTVTKVVVNDNGGTKIVSNFPLFVDATSVTSGQQITTTAGQHTVSETADPGYTGAITGDCAANGTITLVAGDVKTCTITNNDKAPTLVLDKKIINNNTGTATESSFTLTADGGAAGVLSGPGGPGSSDVVSTASFKAGTYTLSESGPTGYSSSEWSCVKNGVTTTGSTVTVALADAVTCTITNDDIPPSLAVFVVDDVRKNEGNSGTTAFTFTVTRSGPLATASAVQYETRDGSATVADGDYQAKTGTLSFDPLETSKTVTVLVNGDPVVEPNEFFTVHLFNPVNGAIQKADGQGLIFNDDGGQTPTPTPGSTSPPNGFEGDINRTVNGVPGTGDGDVTVGDEIQYGKFLIELDCPSLPEQQRLDAGPRETLGDGLIGSSDETAILAYAAHSNATDFNPNVPGWQPTPAGGPTAITNLGRKCQGVTLPEPGTGTATAPESAAASAARIVRVVSRSGAQNSDITVDIEMTAQGNEAGTQYSLSFDPAVLSISSVSGVDTNPDITRGTDAPAGTEINVNADDAANGRIGIVENFHGVIASKTAMGSGASRTGEVRIARLRFHILDGAAAGSSRITFDGSVVRGMAADANGMTLSANYEGGDVSVGASRGVTVSGRVTSSDGRGIRGATVTIVGRDGLARTVTTSSFGYYTFDDVAAATYTIGVSSRQYRFGSRTVTVGDDLVDVNFTGSE